LKADQFELRQCEQNLQDLNAQLNNLDHSLAILKEEKVFLLSIFKPMSKTTFVNRLEAKRISSKEMKPI